MKRNSYIILNILIFVFSLLIVSCADDLLYSNPDIPEGEGILSATVTFTPTAASELGTTRTTYGDTIQNIESLCVLVYDKNRNLFKKYAKGNLKDYFETKYTVDKNKDHLDGSGAHTDEMTTARATFSLPDIPFGQYYIFAVANMGDLSAYDSDIQTVSGLQNISLDWNTDNMAKNNQMFGYFTTDKDMESTGFGSDKPLTFTGRQTDFKIHAWLKRAASKVTVAFDPSRLNQGVTIYIRNVTVRDIPKSCLLGAENTPSSADELYNYLSKYDDPNYKVTSPAVANSRLEYNEDGVIENSGEHTGSSSTDGYKLDNSIRSAVPENAHNVDAPSLFFYENNQNPWLEKNVPNYKDNPRYDKHPQTEGDDKIGNTIHDADNDKDFKDRVPFGTYVEVEAYYISSNPANPGEGSIKYRFMLGKDTSFDYNAQRNYHYKLTLGFKGWANDPDWHIDYVESTPDILVPPVFRVSYLYHQKSELPIKIIGDIEYLTATITENNWAPYDPNPDTNTIVNGYYKVPQTSISTTPSDYIFQWNLAAFQNDEYMTNGKIKNEFGFLSLHLPDRNTTVVSEGFSHGANEKLINHYNDYREGERRFRYDNLTIGDHRNTFNETNSSEDDVYNVNPVLNDANEPIADQRILMLPVWTRALTLIYGSGFSGNNPYEAFERKAVVHIVAQFRDEAKTRLERDVEIYQVKRITNPKGVWRAHDRSKSFDVTLLEAKNSNAESDFQDFTSQGEWTAFIESQTNSGGFSIRPNGKTNGYMQNGVIHGNTGSTINFAIDFGGNVGEDGSECAIVKVLYHGNQCLHKILVRKGYNSPLRMGSRTYTTSTGAQVKGRLWSSFSLYQASYLSGTDGVSDIYNAVLTKNPLMLGSMFRRGRQTKGIFVSNNQRSELGPFKAPGNTTFVVGLKGSGTNGWTDNTWSQIGFRDDINSTKTLGTFISEDGTRYRVPSYDDFEDLTESSEFAFGVFYGSEATEPALTANDAYGLIDPQNEGKFDSTYGMRGVVAYDKETGNQIFFPMGKYGTGRRNNFVLTGNNAGQLRYGDVDYLLTNTRNANNLYRPVPYNLMISSGNIYWIDQHRANTPNSDNGCLGWDMNYFNFDFNRYTANNWRDACPMKFVIVE